MVALGKIHTLHSDGKKDIAWRWICGDKSKNPDSPDDRERAVIPGIIFQDQTLRGESAVPYERFRTLTLGVGWWRWSAQISIAVCERSEGENQHP